MQENHHHMAALMGQYWSEEFRTEDRRLNKVTVFDLNDFFTLTGKDIDRFGNHNYFDLIKTEQFLDHKIKSMTKKVKAENVFKSLLFSEQLEKDLNINKIEDDFFALMDKINLLSIPTLNKSEEKTIKDYIALQYIRSPLRYKFLLDNFLRNQIINISCMSNQNPLNPLCFKNLMFDTSNIELFLNNIEPQIKKIYYDFRNDIENLDLGIVETNLNFVLGQLCCFAINAKQYGFDHSVIDKMTSPGFYENNYEIINQTFVCTITPDKAFLLLPKNYEKINTQLKKILKGVFLPQLELIYSQKIVVHPIQQEGYKIFFKNLFTRNDIRLLYNQRIQQVNFLNTFDFYLSEYQKHKKLISSK